MNRVDTRWPLCLLGALVLHGTLAFVRWHAPGRATEVLSTTPVNAIAIAVDDAPRSAGPAPGGGSLEPEPHAEESAPSQPVPPRAAAPRVARAPVARDLPAVTETPEGTDSEGAAADVFAADDGEAFLPVRPQPRRRTMLDASHAASRAAPEAAVQKESRSNALGTGAGSRGGPGGKGSGKGRAVAERFAFGGPSGAFHATVCFIRPGVKGLKEVKSCPPVASFYTDVLNVPSRRFTQGFPGVSGRFEWFAIQYRGKFKVTKSDHYTFRVVSDDGSILYIDGYKIIDNDGQHPPRSMQTTIMLEAGQHDFYLFYYQGHRDLIALELYVTAFNGTEQLFGPVIGGQ